MVNVAVNEARVSAKDVARRARDRVVDQFLSKAGLKPEELGANAKAAVSQLERELERVAGDGPIGSAYVLRAYQRLRRAHALDLADRFDPGPIPAQASGFEIPKQSLVAKAAGGKWQITARDDHALAQLLRATGLDPRSFGDSVKATLSNAAADHKLCNLGDAAAWTALARKLRTIAVKEGLVDGAPSPQALQRAHDNVRAHTAHVDARRSPAGASLGLARHAPKTTGTGSKNGAVATRIGLLKLFNAKKDELVAAAPLFTRTILRTLGISVNPGMEKTISDLLAGIFNDGSAAPGTPRSTVILGNVFRALSEKSSDDVVKRSHLLGAQVADLLGRAVAEGGLRASQLRGVTGAAFAMIGELVGVIAGKEPAALPEGVKRALVSITKSLSGKGEVGELVRDAVDELFSPRAKADPTVSGGEPERLSEEERAQMIDSMMIKLGVGEDHPRAAAVREVLERVIGRKVDLVALTLNAANHGLAKLGIRSEALSELRGLATDADRALRGYLSRADSLEAQAADVEDRLKTVKDPVANKKLEEARERIAESAEEVAEHVKQIRQRLGLFAQTAVKMVVDHVKGGGGPVAQAGDEHAARRSGTYGGIRPGESAEKRDVREFRAHKCNQIFNDPSLCIEDKIFLVMMWFVAFSDRDREEKLDEIIALDREDAARAKALDDLYRKKQAATAERESAESEYAESKSPAAKSKVESSKLKEDNCDADYQAKKRELDDEAPRSREVKMTELQRLNQLRDNILNMVRSMMDTWSRNSEKVFR